LGERDSVNRSEGEKLLVAKAGGDKADPLARYVVDDEFGDLAYKEESFADKVMFWHKQAAPTEAQINTARGDQVTPVDAVAEQTRLKALTGNGQIIIQQKVPQKNKLPGL